MKRFENLTNETIRLRQQILLVRNGEPYASPAWFVYERVLRSMLDAVESLTELEALKHAEMLKEVETLKKQEDANAQEKT